CRRQQRRGTAWQASWPSVDDASRCGISIPVGEHFAEFFRVALTQVLLFRRVLREVEEIPAATFLGAGMVPDQLPVALAHAAVAVEFEAQDVLLAAYFVRFTAQQGQQVLALY